MLAAFQVADHIVADGVGQSLRREEESHAHRPLRSERRDQVGVFRRHRGGRNLGRVLRVIGLAGMRKPIFRAADRPDERGDGAETCRGAGPVGAILHRLSIGLAALALGGHQFIEVIIEKHNLARDLVAAQAPATHRNFERRPPPPSALSAGVATLAPSAVRTIFCVVFSRHPGIFDQRSRLFAANPMRHGHLLESNLEAERFQFSGDIFDRLFRLGRAGQARADVVREMRGLPPGVIALQRGLLELSSVPSRVCAE